MKIYMIRTIYDFYCVFSETAMNTYSKPTEEDALAEFHQGATFDPSIRTNTNYCLSTDQLAVLNGTNPHDAFKFGTILYEIPAATDTSTYEYW